MSDLPVVKILELAEPIPGREQHSRLTQTTFSDVRLVGPAIIAVEGELNIDGVAFEGDADPAALFTTYPLDPTPIPVGMIIAPSITINDCQVAGITFAVHPATHEKLLTTLRAAREQAAQQTDQG